MGHTKKKYLKKVITISGFHSKSCLSTKMEALQKKFVLPRGFPAKLLSKFGSHILLFFLRLLFLLSVKSFVAHSDTEMALT
jgi:hypothetical protein